MNKFCIILFICLSSIFFSCELPKETAGSYRKIPLLIDDYEREFIEGPLTDAIEKTIQTPREEKIFVLNPVDSANSEWLKSARTSIIAASLESPGPAGQFVRNSLSEDAEKMVLSGEYWLIAKNDLWARNQLVLIITARTADELAARLELNGDDIFRLINDSVNERVSDWLFGSAWREGEQVELEDSIAAEYGFGIRIPRYWNWEKGSAEERFIWLRVLEPERWVFVWWTDLDSAKEFSVARWRHIRDSLCAIYYEGDSVSPHFEPETTGTRIGGRPAVQIRALWENHGKNLGGPLVSYVLSDMETRRLYIVDGAIFAPGSKKEPYMRHVEIICKSFRGNLPKFYAEREKSN